MDWFNTSDEQFQQLVSSATEMGLSVIGAILILVIGFRIAGFVERKLGAILSKRPQMDDTVSSFLASVGKYVVVIVTIIAVLGQFGIETTSLVAVVGAAGLAIGLALQGTLSNVAAGVMLLIFRPFKIGNFVEIAGHAGVVKGVSLFVTELDTGDNVRIIIPNSSVWGSSVKNYNFHDVRRLDQVYGIGYGDDIDKAVSVIKGVLASDERCKTEPDAVVAVTSLGESSVDIVVRVWCDAGDYWPLNWHLLKTVKESFDKEGISIPYPCRSLYMENTD